MHPASAKLVRHAAVARPLMIIIVAPSCYFSHRCSELSS
ncbi:hypothetical protein J2Y55_002686 [Bosea sp. BE125]|nr:hypothetical protein [Bosea sp. BE125]